MGSPAAQLTMPMSDWSAANWAAVFIMWAVMMAAMMLPTAMPMVSVFGTLNRSRGEAGRTLAFVGGYLALWTAFGAAATAAQWALQTGGFLSPMIVSMSPALSGALLVIAGVFQFTPLKHACLRACRSPLGFLVTDWRDGLWGAARMGIRHGLYCLGCCWALMALALRRRRDEFALDCGAHASRRHGEARSEGRHYRKGAGRRHDRRGCGAIDLAILVAADCAPCMVFERRPSRGASRPQGLPTLTTRKVRSSPSSSRTDTYSPTLKAWSPKRKPSSSCSSLLPVFHSKAQVEPPAPPA